MSFLRVRQFTLAGERMTLTNLSAFAYIQEIIPDQDFGWKIDLEPRSAHIVLHHRRERIISLDRAEDLARQVAGNPADLKVAHPKPFKKSQLFSHHLA